MADTRGANLGLFLCQEVIIAAFVRSSRGRAHVTAVGTTPTPRGTVDAAGVRDPARVGQAIRSLLRSMRARASSAAVAMPPGAAGMRSFRLPTVPERERRALVRGELETAGALPIGAGAFGFLWVELTEEEEREQSDVFAFHTDDSVVDGVREALRVAGLRLECMEPYSIAAMRAYLGTREALEPVALLCPSDTHSDLCMLDGARVRYLRRIAGGWEDLRYLTRTASATETGPSTSRSVLLTEEEASAEAPEATPQTLVGLAPADQSVTRSFLASEVARSFAFYSREYKSANVPRSLVILSPRRFAEDIVQTLAPVVPIPVVAEDAAALLDLPESSEGELGLLGYLAAAGVCMAGEANALPRLDTSRQEASALSRRQAPNLLLAGMAGSTVWMILSILAAVALSFLQSSAEVENNLLQRDLTEEWKRHVGPMRNLETFNAARQAQRQVALPAGAILAALAQAYTNGISLTNVKLESGAKVTVEGNAMSPESMQTFADNLAKAGVVKNVTFDMMHQDRDGLFSFRIVGSSAGLSPEGAVAAAGGQG